jgi:iron complex outermembrane receptor protein
VEAQWVSAKTQVQAVRNELATGGYSLMNWHSRYEWKALSFDVGIENLFNRYYANPMGGSYIGQLSAVYPDSDPV